MLASSNFIRISVSLFALLAFSEECIISCLTPVLSIMEYKPSVYINMYIKGTHSFISLTYVDVSLFTVLTAS